MSSKQPQMLPSATICTGASPPTTGCCAITCTCWTCERKRARACQKAEP